MYIERCIYIYICIIHIIYIYIYIYIVLRPQTSQIVIIGWSTIISTTYLSEAHLKQAE